MKKCKVFNMDYYDFKHKKHWNEFKFTLKNFGWVILAIGIISLGIYIRIQFILPLH